MGLAGLLVSAGCSANTNTLSLRNETDRKTFRQVNLYEISAGDQNYFAMPRGKSEVIFYDGKAISESSILDFTLANTRSSTLIRTPEEAKIQPAISTYLVRGKLSQNNEIELDYDGEAKRIFVVTENRTMPSRTEDDDKIVRNRRLPKHRVKTNSVRILEEEYLVVPIENPFGEDFALTPVSRITQTYKEGPNNAKRGIVGELFVPISGGITTARKEYQTPVKPEVKKATLEKAP